MERNLVDNDVVLKISQYELVDEYYSITGGADTIYILPTLKYRFYLSSQGKALTIVRDEKALKRLLKFVDEINEIKELPPSQIINILESIPEIDEGEAILFALAINDESSLTYTGDKRALKALSSKAAVNDIADKLNGRLKCLEQTVAEMLLQTDDEIIFKKIQGYTWDSALRACFSSSIENSLEGLKNYYDSVNKECNNLLAPFPK